jgi:hypothetical protein
MENIFLLPTNKPSRLRIGNNGNFVYGIAQTSTKSFNDDFTNQNIYITNSEDINENDYIITKDGRLVQVSYLLSKDLQGASKVILTTDQDLIKDGVQAIDDEFLEWFMKNPSCEFVEVEEVKCKGQCWKFIESDYEDTCLSGCEKIEYKIIIPKEEPKQETVEDKLKSLVEEWQKRQEQYVDIAYKNVDNAHANRKFTYKAMATRDCWKELLKLIEDEK